MTDSEHPHDSPSNSAVTHRPSGLRLLRAPSRLPSGTEWTLGQSIDVLTTCQHPENSQSSAVVVETDGSQIPIRWCGACGAIALWEDGAAQWIRSGLALFLADEERWPALAGDVQVLANAATELTKAAKALVDRVTDPPNSPWAELLPTIHELESVSGEIERGVRALFGELVPRATPC